MTTKISTSHRGKLADTHHVDQLIRNYKKQRWIHNTKRLGKEDSLSTWYGLEELSDFLELAKEQHADGIKMYYGVYPADFAESPALQGRQTVVLVATRQKITVTGTANKDIYIHKEGRSEILAFNFGHVCPPFCPPYADGNVGIDMEKIGISIIDRIMP